MDRSKLAPLAAAARRGLLAAALALAALPVLGHAQSSPWPGMSVGTLSPIYVHEQRGVETMGVLLGFSPDSIFVESGGTRLGIPRTSVLEIQKRGDSKKNGALIGAGIGLVVGLMAPWDCKAGGHCQHSLPIALVAAGEFALIGVGLDALFKGRTTIYRASGVP